MILPILNIKPDNLVLAAFCRQLDKNFTLVAERNEAYAVSNSYSISVKTAIDSFQVNATAGALILTLPAPTRSLRYRVIKTDASANTVTLSGNGYLINGSATVVLAAQYAKVWVEATGTDWLII